jgi:hypothetical protein
MISQESDFATQGPVKHFLDNRTRGPECTISERKTARQPLGAEPLYIHGIQSAFDEIEDYCGSCHCYPTLSVPDLPCSPNTRRKAQPRAAALFLRRQEYHFETSLRNSNYETYAEYVLWQCDRVLPMAQN